MTQVSVIIPTYNRAALLPRAMDSVLAQQGVNWELVVVDDGSTDNTPGVLASYTGNPRVHIVTRPNRGVSAARNAGVAASSSPLLAFLDSDDEWLPGKLRAQVDLHEKTACPIQQTREIWMRKGKRVNPPRYCEKRDGDIYIPSLERCMVTPSSVMMTRALFHAFGGFDEHYPACEDYALWINITSRHPVKLIDKNYLIRHGGREDQLSASVPLLDRYRIRAMARLLEKGGLTGEQRAACLNTFGKKLSIYKQGCARRGKQAELNWCDGLENRFF